MTEVQLIKQSDNLTCNKLFCLLLKWFNTIAKLEFLVGSVLGPVMLVY